MLLYHYAKERYTTLLTLEKQGKLTKKDKEEAHKDYVEKYKETRVMPLGYYYEHISFFIKRPPIENISEYFDDHFIWYKGNELYEHVVESKDIGSFMYEIVEHPEHNELFYNNRIGDKTFYERQAEVEIDNLYRGKDNEMFEIGVSNIDGDINNNFVLLKSRPNFSKLNTLYAGTIPHVMIYPVLGKIKPLSIKKVVVG